MYALERNGERLREWGTKPNKIDLRPHASRTVHSPDVGAIADGFSLVEFTPPEPAIGKAHVDAERDRRMNGEVVFRGHSYQSDTLSVELIRDAHAVASTAIVSGSQAGDLRWYDPDTDFAWRTLSNTWVPMDAVTCLDFAETVMDYRSACVRAGIVLKASGTIPEDYTDDKYWPA